MRSLLELKDATIEELRCRLNKIGSSGDDSTSKKSKPTGTIVGENYRENMALMTKALRDREDQIEELQEKVAQATRYELFSFRFDLIFLFLDYFYKSGLHVHFTNIFHFQRP